MSKKEKSNKYKILNNGLKCPIMGLGTSLIKTDRDINVVYQSIKDGVRLIDTEPKNEELVGKGIKKALDEKIVSREDLFIVTKLELEEKKDPEQALKKSLERLQLEYVDLYLDHWPSCMIINNDNKESNKLIPIRETWKQMERLVKRELTKSIGISNYNVQNILNILSFCTIKPVVNEVEFNPYLYQKELKDFCDKECIFLFAYNPLAKGEYVDREIVFNKNLDLFNEPAVVQMNNKQPKITKGQIILNWHLIKGVVPIPGTSKPDRMKENLKAGNFSLKNNLLDQFKEVNKQYRFNDGSKIFGIDIFE